MRNGHIWLAAFILLILFSAFHAPEESVQTLHFRVLKGHEQIGMLKVQKKSEKGRLTYGLVSWVNIRLFMQVELKENITDIFEQGILLHSTQHRYINGSLKQNHVLKRAGPAYTWHDQDNHYKVLDDSIQYSTLSLYFKEPVPGLWVYSQNFGSLLQISKSAAHTYTLSLPNGNHSVYRYNETGLQEVESHTVAGQVKFVLEQ